MARKWVNVSQACAVLGISRRTLARWVNEGRVESKKVDGRRIVLVSKETNQGVTSESYDNVLVGLRDEVEFLRQELERKDAIILSMTGQVERTQLMLEEHRKPFWKRWFRRG
jgi:excisionase family DNA binding protein